MRLQPGLLNLIAVILLMSCNQHRDDSLATICGDTDLESGTYLYLVRIDTASYVTIDSAKTDSDGSFCLNLKSENPGFYLLQFQKQQSVPLIIFPGDSIVAGIHENTVTISGGKEAGIYDQFRQNLIVDETVADSLGSVLILARDLENYTSVKRKTDSAWTVLLERAKMRAIAFLSEQPASLSQLLVVNSKIQNTFIFDQQNDTAFLFKVDDQLMKSYSGSQQAISFNYRMNALRLASNQERIAREKMTPGRLAPVISLPGTDGKILNLAPSKNRLTLVFFWSTTDGLSRKAAQQLKIIRDRYKARGFEVFAVCFDQFPDRWIASVNLDKLWWINVNEKQSFGSQVSKDWLIQKLPVMVLIDNNGKIAGRFTETASVEKILKQEPGN